MNIPRPEWPDSNWRQLLVAYADGELDPPQSALVESWLEKHPEAARDLKALRDLSPNNFEFWSAVEPPVPSRESWAMVWNGVRRQPVRNRATPRTNYNRWWRRGLLALALAVSPAAAAAVVLAVSDVSEPGDRRSELESVDETFVVAANSDVEILSVRDADVPCLVVGEPPLKTPIALAASGDVRLDGVRPDWDGTVPTAHMGDGANAPMIFPQVARNP